MEKYLPTSDRNTPNEYPISPKSYNPKTKHKNMSFNYSSKHSISILVISLTIFILFQLPSLIQTPLSASPPPPPPSPPSPPPSWPPLDERLRHSVTFLPLKDLRYADKALQGHTWFMSSMYDTHEEGEVQYQKFPSKASKGRILCIKGHDTHDGSWNYYGLAWPQALPQNATLMNGLTFVSYNHYDYGNIWHGLSSIFPFVAWHMKNECKLPSRWVLYHWGELRTKMSLWLKLILEATFGGPINIEGFEGIEEDNPVCFEEAVVMRHNEGEMSRQRRMEAYDLIRCKARMFCNLTMKSHLSSKLVNNNQANNNNNNNNNVPSIGMTLFMRSGARSFKNESQVISIFESECAKFKGCKLMVAHSDNLTFCQQVELMSLTDILVSPHGAQLTNMFLMDRNSSVMEFFPKGWLKLAGVGQFVYHWIASWSGMIHQGAYRDPLGDHPCPYHEDDPRCMSFFKNAQIGHNHTYFRQWATNVLNQVFTMKMDQASNDINLKSTPLACTC